MPRPTLEPESPRAPGHDGVVRGQVVEHGRHAGPPRRALATGSRPGGKGRQPGHLAPKPRRGGPSRRVRLRRTLAGAVSLSVVGATMLWLTRDTIAPEPHAESTVTQRPAVTVTSAAPQPSATATSVPERGTGTFAVLQVPNASEGVARGGRTVTYTVEVEGGLQADPAELVRIVRSVLVDRRGWQRLDSVRFVNVSPAREQAGADVDIRVTLASPDTTDELCAPLRTRGQVSCWNGTRTMLNYRRWMFGSATYGKDVARYRTYLVNHEVGHGLGHSHVPCPGPGRRAPIMLQQTLGLDGCTPWPYPATG